MVRMAHPTDMAIPECHDFATHQSFPGSSWIKKEFGTMQTDAQKDQAMVSRLITDRLRKPA